MRTAVVNNRGRIGESKDNGRLRRLRRDGAMVVGVLQCDGGWCMLGVSYIHIYVRICLFTVF